MKKKECSAEKKARIVIEVLEGGSTLAEIASREGVSARTITGWRREFIENAARAFSVSAEEREAEKARQAAEEREKSLAEKVGQLTIEVDWLKKKSEQAGAMREKRAYRRQK